jgi:hypothetical protein
LRFAKTAADRFTETILPAKKDCEVSMAELKVHDIILLGGIEDNQLMGPIAEKSGLQMGKGFFQWQGKTYAASNEGIAVVIPNPYNPERMITLFAANSALQLYQMTRTLPRFPSWAIFKEDQITDRGYHELGMPLLITSPVIPER